MQNKKIKVLVDAREAVRNRSGIGVVARELVQRFTSKNFDKFEFVVVKPKEKRLFNSKFGRLIEFIWWKTGFLLFKAKKENADYIFSLDPVGCLLWKKNIVIFYDFIFFIYPDWTGLWGKLWRVFLPLTIKKTTDVFAISNETAKDAWKYLKKPPSIKGITVIPLGFRKDIYNLNPIEYGKELNFNGYNLSNEKYILFVGNAEPRRNLEMVIKSFSIAKKQIPFTITLVIAGKNDNYQSQIHSWAYANHVSEDIIITGYVDDETLANLYRNANVYVYPSVYEGFGLTIVEAMACGCPVITSNCSCLPEVAGDAAILIDPMDTSELANSMVKVISNESFKNALVKKGIERSSNFQWELTEQIIIEHMGKNLS
jgi:glycosyltransferase involved in cell wall biosynthesis